MADAPPPWLLDAAPPGAPSGLSGKWLSDRISPAPQHIRLELEARGFRFGDDGAASVALADAAAAWIRRAPTLEAIVATVVRDVHLVTADPSYDTSHSEPRWRSTIFVSIPERADGVGASRLAEGVIHEAMHLHLTNTEARIPLVRNFRGQMASPWRAEPRSYQGVAHALFVFTCLTAFFREILKIDAVEDDVRRHMRTRISEISGEVARLDVPELVGGLTERGTILVHRWLLSAAAGCD
jgi:HEXXH motif-containing protein